MQHARRDDQIKAPVEVARALDRQLPRFEVRQFILLLQRFGVLETRRADIDGNDARAGMTECELRRLPRSASGNQNVEVRAVFFARPKQMKLGAVDVRVLPQSNSAIEILEWRWVRMTRVKLADRIFHD